MFFGPKLPVSTHEKVWLEMEFQRLVDCFGLESLRGRETILPSNLSLALHTVKTEEDVVDLKSRIATIYGIENDSLGVSFFEDDDGSVPTIQDEDGQIVAYFPTSMLSHKVRVASHLSMGFATLICESDQYKSSGINSEFVALWHGFAPIMAEATVMTSKYSMDGFDHWSISKHGWMSAIQLGYVMAVREHVLGNGLPDFHKQLVIDAKDSLIKGLKYLSKTDDCLVDQNHSCLGWDHAKCLSASKSKFASQRLAALEFFPANGETLTGGELEIVLAATDDKDDFVRGSGYLLLEYAPESTPEVVRAIQIGLDDREPQCQLGAIRASAVHGSSIGGLGYALQLAIEGNDSQLMNYAAASMAANDLCGEKELKLILERLRRAIVRGAEDVSALIGVLNHVSDDPKKLVIDYFADEEDLKLVAVDLFDEMEA